MIEPTFEQIRGFTEGHTIVPIAMELFADYNTSVGVLNNIRRNQQNCYLLESVNTNESWGRYSFLGYDPMFLISAIEGEVYEEREGVCCRLDSDPPEIIRMLLEKYRSPRIAGFPPFTGGLVGYFSYEFAKYFEPALQLQADNPEGFDDFRLMMFDKVIAFDHYRQKIVLIVNISTTGLENAYMEGVTRLKEMRGMVLQHSPLGLDQATECGMFVPLFTKEQYCRRVKQVQQHIIEGDVFQAVPSNRFSAPFSGDLFHIYRTMRTLNPSPYMVYMKIGDMEIACASPETLVSLHEGVLHTYPLAGTCGRGATPEEDAELVAALLKDEKEGAEHDMLVDLGRNDIGKISVFGTVKLKEYRTIKQLSHVSHIATRIEGRLAGGCDMLDAVAAVLPAGTLSGAPKKRAMEIIDQLEGTHRGVYGGAIGYLDFAGNMDLCIGIRMAVKKKGRVHVQSGAGVVADSVPEKEYEETRRKAQAVMEAVHAVHNSRNAEKIEEV